MHYSLDLQHVEPIHRERVEALLAHYLQELERQTARFPADAVYLHVVIEQHPTHPLFRVGLTLHVPKRVLSAREEGQELQATLRGAFDELMRQLQKHQAFLRQEHLWQRPARRQELRQRLKTDPLPGEHEREVLLTLLERHLKPLYNFVRREIAVLQATGDLLPGDLTPEDVIDTVVLRAARDLAHLPSQLAPERWLLKLTLEVLRAEVRHRRAARASALSLEHEAPLESSVATSTRDDEIYNFYQPDEKLRLEDIVPDPYIPSPEEIVACRDLQRYINQTLAMLPEAWRTAFVLRYVEECSLPEVARIMDMPEEDVARVLEHACAFLQQKLVEAALAPAPGEAISAPRFFAAKADIEVPEAYGAALAEKVRGSPAR